MPIEFSAQTRTQNIKILKTTPLDVLVIGGGIVGAGLIRDLALNGGIKAGLIEQGDFANGTSSATSQLIHGGFRYLLKRDIDLVKQARKEREILLRIAPNLVKPIPLAVLRYKGDPYPLAGIQVAAHYYNHLSQTDKAEKSRAIRNVQKIQQLVGPIATDTLKGCVVLWDSTVDDARLTLATLKDAHQHGAVVTNYVRFLNFVGQPDKSNSMYRITAQEAISGERFEIASRKIVSTTGPWTDRLWRKDPSYDGVPRLRTENAKGIHILVPRCGIGDDQVPYGVVTFTQTERSHNRNPRVIFILPGDHDTSIVGTTETTPESNPGNVRPSESEVLYLLSETQRIFPETTLDRGAIIAAYAGTRPLIASNQRRRTPARPEFVSREHLITESPSGVVYIYGGKLTTHRQMAEETVNYLAEALSVPRNCKTAIYPLPNATGEAPNRYGGNSLQHSRCAVGNSTYKKTENGHQTKLPPGVDTERLIHRYGNGYQAIQQFILQDATLAEPITPSLPFIKAELLYAQWGEMAMTLDDLLWRRTRIGWTQGQGIEIAPKIAQFLGERNNWNQAKITAEVEAYRQRISWLNYNL